jgi:hypothetical protein
VPVRKLRLSMRPEAIAELAVEMAKPIGESAKPEALDWRMYPTCTAVVIDLDRRRAATSC